MKTMSAAKLKDKLSKKQVCLIDVRELWEYEMQNIEGAYHIPLKDLSIEKLPNRSMPIVIHCAAGIRSAKACEKLLHQDPTLDVFNLEGGIKAWCDAGYPVCTPKPKGISIDRQVHIIAGSLVLIGILLGAFVHGGFYVLSALIGLGLLFSGLSGWCGMAILLGKMPWNQ